MGNTFQPEKPYEPTRLSTTRGSVIWLALISAILVVMLLALGLPAVMDQERSWPLTLGIGALVFVAILIIGHLKSSKNKQ